MRKRNKILLAMSGLLLTAGAATGLAIAKRGDGEGWRAGQGGQGQWQGQWRGHGWRGHKWRSHGRRGAGGRFGREFTQADFDTRMRERFARFDGDSDGVIDAGEIQAVIGSRMERRRARGAKRWQRKLSRLDANNDGKISRAEFEARARAKFARVDLNNDGVVTDDDLPPRLRGRGLLSGERDAGLAMMGRGGRSRRGRKLRKLARLRGMDANKDGSVTLEEALAGAVSRFSRLDANGDGGVDKSDRDAQLKEALDYRVKRFIHRYGIEADRAGNVTRAQFDKIAKERFARRDANNDGKITRDEMGRRAGGWKRGRRHFRGGWRDRPRGGRGPGQGPRR